MGYRPATSEPRLTPAGSWEIVAAASLWVGLVPPQLARPSLGTIAGISVIFRRSRGNNTRKAVGCSLCRAKAGCFPGSGKGAKPEGLEVPCKGAGVPCLLSPLLNLRFRWPDPLLEASCFAPAWFHWGRSGIALRVAPGTV